MYNVLMMCTYIYISIYFVYVWCTYMHVSMYVGIYVCIIRAKLIVCVDTIGRIRWKM